MSDKPQYQVNFKLSSGDLINLYADTADQLAEQLSYIQGLAGQIISASRTLNGSTPPSAYPAVVTQTFPGATVVSETPAPYQAPIQSQQPVVTNPNSCKHGARVYRESKPGAPKAWKGYFCPSPKGTPDQCEPVFSK